MVFRLINTVNSSRIETYYYQGDGFQAGERGVSAYRIYVLDENDHVVGPPHIVVCDDDQQATYFARQFYLQGRPIEVWDETRRVVKLNPSGQ
jgi:hypothetical protein